MTTDPDDPDYDPDFDIYAHLGVPRDGDSGPLDDAYLDAVAQDNTGAGNVRPLPAPRWTPRPLSDIVQAYEDGTLTPLRPRILQPTGSDRGMFYEARINGVFGESGSGKSWLAILAAAQVLARGHTVTFIDLEDVAELLVPRLRMVGVPAAVIAANVRYFEQPDTPMTTGDADAVADGAAMVIVDAMAGLLHLEGADPDSNAGVQRVAPSLHRIARRGPAVVVLDHTAKADGDGLWPIGAQAKRALISGAAYRAISRSPFHSDRGGGRLDLLVAKDRPGGLRHRHGQTVASLQQHGSDNVAGWGLTLRGETP